MIKKLIKKKIGFHYLLTKKKNNEKRKNIISNKKLTKLDLIY